MAAGSAVRQQALVAWTQGLQLMEDEDDEVPTSTAVVLLEFSILLEAMAFFTAASQSMYILAR